MTFHAYVSRSGSLIVRKFHSPAHLQEIRRYVREDLGQYEATDIERARVIANQLRKAVI